MMLTNKHAPQGVTGSLHSGCNQLCAGDFQGLISGGILTVQDSEERKCVCCYRIIIPDSSLLNPLIVQ